MRFCKAYRIDHTWMKDRHEVRWLFICLERDLMIQRALILDAMPVILIDASRICGLAIVLFLPDFVVRHVCGERIELEVDRYFIVRRAI